MHVAVSWVHPQENKLHHVICMLSFVALYKQRLIGWLILWNLRGFPWSAVDAEGEAMALQGRWLLSPVWGGVHVPLPPFEPRPADLPNSCLLDSPVNHPACRRTPLSNSVIPGGCKSATVNKRKLKKKITGPVAIWNSWWKLLNKNWDLFCYKVPRAASPNF